MTNINEIQDHIITEFEALDELDKYERLIELGKDLPAPDATLKKEENAMPGCQSNVWLLLKQNKGEVTILADSDSAIVKGLLSLIIRVYDKQPAETIVNADPYFIQKIGLSKNLSPARQNGLKTILQQIRKRASCFR